MGYSNLSAQQLRRAADLRDRIDALQRELVKTLDGTATTGSGGKRRRMSPAGIERIRAAAKARWAKVRRAGGKGGSARARRRMSAAARARLGEIARARWKRAKASGKNAL